MFCQGYLYVRKSPLNPTPYTLNPKPRLLSGKPPLASQDIAVSTACGMLDAIVVESTEDTGFRVYLGGEGGRGGGGGYGVGYRVYSCTWVVKCHEPPSRACLVFPRPPGLNASKRKLKPTLGFSYRV